MSITIRHDLKTVAGQFEIHGEFLAAEPYGSGHINDTYCVYFDQGGSPGRVEEEKVLGRDEAVDGRAATVAEVVQSRQQFLGVTVQEVGAVAAAPKPSFTIPL